MVPLLTKRIVINKKTKDDYIQLYNKNNIADKYIDRIQIINTAIEVPQILTKKKLPKKKLNINYFGRIAPEKRLHLFVKIAERAFNIGNFKIYGPKQENYQFIEPYYEKNITDNKCMTIVYNKTDILLITSYREGLPVVIQEAMAHGVVCISTDVGSISEHITNGINGFIVNNEMPENLIIDSFVQIINNLYSDQDYLHYLSVQSHKYAFDNFNMKIFNHEIKHLFSNE
jgi:glycosyltransferase involved in cell wall biosynthesis